MSCLLLDMPSELIEHTATFLPKPDLLTLRLVNKELAARTARVMLNENFSNLQILLSSRASLRKALRVVRHDTFRESVNNVTIFTNQFHRWALGNPELLDPQHYDSSVAGNMTREQRRKFYLKWVEDQEWMVETGNDERELREVLYRLRNCRDLDIKMQLFCHGTSDEVLARDHDWLFSHYGAQPFFANDSGNQRLLQIVLNAIVESAVYPIWFCCSPGSILIP